MASQISRLGSSTQLGMLNITCGSQKSAFKVMRFSSNSLLVRIVAREALRLLGQIRMNVLPLG
jgi:hypothetical protein